MTKPKAPKTTKPAKAIAGSTRRKVATVRPTIAPSQRTTKQQRLIELLRRPEGATIAQLAKELDWHPHSIRGAISGVFKKKLGLKLTSTRDDDGDRHYRIV